MSNAKKCDVCGELYEFSDVGRPIVPNGGIVTGVNLLVTYHSDLDSNWVNGSFDLCNRCARRIFEELHPDEEFINIKED